jgi:G:T/U-mismatch repair DNA glycosylase
MDMKTIKHRFCKHKLNQKTEILILGTFNPDTEKNKAEFFYGRSRNYLWRLLPLAFKKKDLKTASVKEKLAFIEQQKIDFIDLIDEVYVEDGQEANYADDYIDSHVTKWRNVINEIKPLEDLKRVVFTRKTFTKIPNMKKQVEIIREYCLENKIAFDVLPTPSRFYNNRKQNEWNAILNYRLP